MRDDTQVGSLSEIARRSTLSAEGYEGQVKYGRVIRDQLRERVERLGAECKPVIDHKDISPEGVACGTARGVARSSSGHMARRPWA
jgi:hypothetical protein